MFPNQFQQRHPASGTLSSIQGGMAPPPMDSPVGSPPVGGAAPQPSFYRRTLGGAPDPMQGIAPSGGPGRPPQAPLPPMNDLRSRYLLR